MNLGFRCQLKKIVIRLLPIYHFFLVRKLRKRKQINIVFIAMSLSMWRFQNLYNLLSKHPKFNVNILIFPCISYTEEQRMKDKQKLMQYLDENAMSYIPYLEDKPNLEVLDIMKNSDVLFYPQPYWDIFPGEVGYRKFYHKLLCYSPYAFWMSKGDWSYNLPLHNFSWKVFYPTTLHKKDAMEIAYNRGRNVEVVGYLNTDNFMRKSFKTVWKFQKIQKKRIIWAPHFTISSEGFVEQSNFLWMSDFMLDIAGLYADKIQIAFKPHPRLFSELVNHKEWGYNRATYYYNQWKMSDNTQLESGDFVDLFMTSDAMIHDCGSFCVEYHYSQKPVMYIAENFEEQVSLKGEFGQLAMRQHYIGKNQQDIIDFIDNVVLKGEDPMKEGREQFKKDYLLPPNGKTVVQNTMDALLKELC